MADDAARSESASSAPASEPASATTLRDLVALVERLRAPDGCPWDREQRLADVRAYLLEEAHETAAAIDEESWTAIGGELGDLLFQVAFVLRLGEEAGALTAEQVIAGIHAKMVARHPHVFGDERAADANEVRRAWERRKAESAAGESLLAGVPASLPALVACYRLSQKAAGVGFDWPDVAAVLAKVHEELAEVERELPVAPNDAAARSALEDEIGDLLFAVANLARHAGVDPERALQRTNAKFRRRFAHVERGVAARGRKLGDVPLDDLEALWQEAKRER
ncbi:MAG TPA: nucleoside triphosphate pyrophosphohydrolase [Thermoanaerobaculia bacterium]|jgi:MazG family protein|nr:nucleoside triphosphate pyrophosphohydrolase [Thermoanaerobaculia bacterium]